MILEQKFTSLFCQISEFNPTGSTWKHLITDEEITRSWSYSNYAVPLTYREIELFERQHWRKTLIDFSFRGCWRIISLLRDSWIKQGNAVLNKKWTPSF